jgi:hypothetical protein
LRFASNLEKNEKKFRLKGMKMFCSNCGKPIKDHAEFCGACGKAINTGVKYCGVCGFLSASDGKFCLNCGTKFAKKRFGKLTSGAPAYPVTVHYQKAVYDFLSEYGRAEDDKIKLVESKKDENEKKSDKNAAVFSDESAYFDPAYYYDPYSFDPYAMPYDPYAVPYDPYIAGITPYAPMPYAPVPYAPAPYPPAPYAPAPYPLMPYAPTGYPYPYPPYGAQDPYFGYGQPYGAPNPPQGMHPNGKFSYEERFSFGVQPPPRARPRPYGPMYIPCRDRALEELYRSQTDCCDGKKRKKEKARKIKKSKAKMDE